MAEEESGYWMDELGGFQMPGRPEVLLSGYTPPVVDPRDCCFTPDWAVDHLVRWLVQEGEHDSPGHHVVIDPFAGDAGLLEHWRASHKSRLNKDGGFLIAQEARTMELTNLRAQQRMRNIDAWVLGDSYAISRDLYGSSLVSHQVLGQAVEPTLVLSNPPYRAVKFTDSIELCLDIAPWVMLLLPSTVTQTQDRAKWWAAGGHGLLYELKLGTRPPFEVADEFQDYVDPKTQKKLRPGGRKATNQQEYVWLVFRRGYTGRPQIGWLPWEASPK